MKFKKLSFFGNTEEAPGFFKRGLALCFDLVIILMITTPISSLLIKFMYHNDFPLEVIYKAIPAVPDPNETFSSLLKKIFANPDVVEYFAHEHVLAKTLIDQLTQLAIFATYFLFFWHKFQTTPGKMLFRLKVVDEQTLLKPTFVQLFLRALGFVISLLMLGFGFIICIFNKEKRCLHDYMARTKVIYRP